MNSTADDIRFYKLLLFTNSLVPLALLGWDAVHGGLGANPLEFVTRTTGMLTLVFLTISLAVTPIRKAFEIPWLIKFRRMAGLFAFFYGSLHFITYVWFDKYFKFPAIVHDIGKRPFILLGMLSFGLMIPLALTSTNNMVKRLGGKRWNRLHQLVYVSGVAGALHYYLLVKADIRKPAAFAVAVALLLAYRLAKKIFPHPVRPAPNT